MINEDCSQPYVKTKNNKKIADDFNKTSKLIFKLAISFPIIGYLFFLYYFLFIRTVGITVDFLLSESILFICLLLGVILGVIYKIMKNIIKKNNIEINTPENRDDKYNKIFLKLSYFFFGLAIIIYIYFSEITEYEDLSYVLAIWWNIILGIISIISHLIFRKK